MIRWRGRRNFPEAECLPLLRNSLKLVVCLRNDSTALTAKIEVFKPIKYEKGPVEKQKKIFKRLILLQRNRDKHNEILKHKARTIMDESEAKVGTDIFDTCAPAIDYSTAQLI